jgi:hypothetical protein
MRTESKIAITEVNYTYPALVVEDSAPLTSSSKANVSAARVLMTWVVGR